MWICLCKRACWIKQFWLHDWPLAELHNTSRTNTITLQKLDMSILVPKFNMLWKRLLLFKLVSFGISQYFYKDANENFLVYDSGISLISSMAFTPFLYCWECQRVWVVKNSYPITLEIINQLIQSIHCTKNPIS